MKRQILVADDTRQVYGEFQSAFQGQDIGVSHASSMSDTLESFRNQFYCLVVLDIHLPWNDLLELVRRLHTVQPVPMIVLTPPLKTEEIAALFQAGASLPQKKPVNYSIPI